VKLLKIRSLTNLPENGKFLVLRGFKGSRGITIALPGKVGISGFLQGKIRYFN